MPGWTDRSFDVQMPSIWDGTSPLPVILSIHGGGGNKAAAEKVTCPAGDTSNPSCLPSIAMARGFVVVRPDGTGARPLRNLRTWNAGGGHDSLNCASGPACAAGIDDIAYFKDLLDELGRIFPLDASRVFATGLSNGGAMSHRLACELPDRIAAIAALGGTNQFAGGGGACTTSVPVLQIHGTEDPCWTYASSALSCLSSDGGIKIGVAESMEGWRMRNGCGSGPVEVAMPDTDPNDGTRSFRTTWNGCTAALELIRVEGGGHTWPRGYQYFGTGRVGRVPQDFGSETIVEFFLAHPRSH